MIKGKRTYDQPKGGDKKRVKYSVAPRRMPKAGPEWKYLDTALTGTVDTTGGTLLLNGLSLGNTGTTRVGLNVTIKSIEIRLYTASTPGTGADQIHRVALYVDKQTNAAQAAATDFLTANNTIAMRNLANRKRFKCLMDKTYTVNATGEDGSQVYWHEYLRPKYIKTEYNAGNAGTVADITTNSVFLYLVGSLAAGATAGVSYGTARIRYTDY